MLLYKLLYESVGIQEVLGKMRHGCVASDQQEEPSSRIYDDFSLDWFSMDTQIVTELIPPTSGHYR